MNLTTRQRSRGNLARKLGRYFYRGRERHDPWLVLSMASFNFSGRHILDQSRAGAFGRC